MSAMSSKSPGETANGTFRPSTSVSSNQASISSATFSGVPTTHRAGAADADMLGHLAHGPDPVRIGAGDIVHRAAAGVVLDMADLLVEVVGREIDAGPARHQRQRALGIDVAAVVGVFRLGLGLGAAEDDRHHAEHQDFGRVAADLRGQRADRRDPRRR